MELQDWRGTHHLITPALGHGLILGMDFSRTAGERDVVRGVGCIPDSRDNQGNGGSSPVYARLPSGS